MTSSEEYFARTGLRGLARDVRWAYSDRTPIGFSRRLKATRAGFKPESAVAYDFERNDYRDYLPDTSWRRLAAVNGQATTALLANKLLFYREFHDRLPLPQVYAFVANGHLVPLSLAGEPLRGAPRTHELTSFEAVLSHLEERGPLIVKPLSGDKGRGVHLLRAAHGQFFEDAEPLPAEELLARLRARDGNLLVEKVEQADYAKHIFPQATNSVRLMIFGGAATANEPFMPVAGHRFGRTASAPVDNTAKGGLISPLQEGTALLDRGRQMRRGARHYDYFEVHPDSGAQLAGVEVPRLLDVVKQLLDFSKRHPYLACVGWDVVITDDGFRVLEANYHASLRIQVSYPYLKNERTRAFLAYHGLLPAWSQAD